MVFRICLLYLILSYNVYIEAQNLVQNYEFSDVQEEAFYPGMNKSNVFNYWVEGYTMGDGFTLMSACGAHDTNCFANTNAVPVYACPGASIVAGAVDYYCPKPYAGKGYGFIINARDSSELVTRYTMNSFLTYYSTALAYRLLRDSIYCTEIHVQVMKGKKSGGFFELTDDGLGMHFSDTSKFPGLPWNFGLSPQVGNWGMLDTISQWQKLKGSFIADGTEQYLHIGNFDPLNAKQPWRFQSNAGPNGGVFGLLAFDAVYVYNCRDTLFSVLQEDTTVCYGEPAWLAPKLEGFKLRDSITTYHWETPTGTFTTQDTGILATQPGQYKVQVVINKRFKSQTTFTLKWLPPPPDSNLVADTLVICLNQNEVNVKVPYIFGASYLWPNGDTTRTQTFTWPGTYNLDVSTKCWLHQEEFVVEKKNCGNILYVPNAFTPNGDGVNDYFEIYGTDDKIILTILDRWGNIVFSSRNYQNNWDGTHNGQPLEPGAYTYQIYWAKDLYTTGRKMGTVMLLRP